MKTIVLLGWMLTSIFPAKGEDILIANILAHSKNPSLIAQATERQAQLTPPKVAETKPVDVGDYDYYDDWR